MQLTAWWDVLLLLQSALNNEPSPSHYNDGPSTASMGMEPMLPIYTFLKSKTVKAVTINELQFAKTLNIEALQDRCAGQHPAVQSSYQAAQSRSHQAMSRTSLPNFNDVDYVLVA